MPQKAGIRRTSFGYRRQHWKERQSCTPSMLSSCEKPRENWYKNGAFRPLFHGNKMDYTLIPVAKLVDLIADPFDRWETNESVTRELVQKTLTDGSYALASESFSHGKDQCAKPALWHARRIAYLIKHGW